MPRPTLGCPCEGQHLSPAFAYTARPVGEIAFPLVGEYRREYRRCSLCEHWFSRHEMDLSALYDGTYVDATYGDSMRRTYERIMALPRERSDNLGRVAAVRAFAERRFGTTRPHPSLLDVGSGLAVFPARMKEVGWRCTALDPDSRASAHAREVAGVTAVTGDFRRLADTLDRFDVISFNKVLEHVEDPVAMLAASLSLVVPSGFVYVELPDVAAAVDGPGREEFFIEHHHVFSAASVAFLAVRAGFRLLALENLREPSGKHTLRAFLAPSAETA
jgi:2-polyprenyl-3-methyl-5-hydroxy-6-metoxy-1,4-benzoquinol methylase